MDVALKDIKKCDISWLNRQKTKIDWTPEISFHVAHKIDMFSGHCPPTFNFERPSGSDHNSLKPLSFAEAIC